MAWSILAFISIVNVAFKDSGIDDLCHSQLSKYLLYLLYRFLGFCMLRKSPLIGPSLPTG